jgi:hypothetical protein
MNGFSITYDIVTPESAEDGDVADSGFLVEGVTFREAMDELRWYRGGHVEADSYPVRNPRWFTFIAASENYATGEVTSYSLHIPEHITEASRQRIARLLGCYGVSK